MVLKNMLLISHVHALNSDWWKILYLVLTLEGMLFALFFSFFKMNMHNKVLIKKIWPDINPSELVQEVIKYIKQIIKENNLNSFYMHSTVV